MKDLKWLNLTDWRSTGTFFGEFSDQLTSVSRVSVRRQFFFRNIPGPCTLAQPSMLRQQWMIRIRLCSDRYIPVGDPSVITLSVREHKVQIRKSTSSDMSCSNFDIPRSDRRSLHSLLSVSKCGAERMPQGIRLDHGVDHLFQFKMGSVGVAIKQPWK